MKYLLLLALLPMAPGKCKNKVIYCPKDPNRYMGRVTTIIEHWNTEGDTITKTYVQWRHRP